SEAALRTRICSDAAMRAQVDRIATLAGLENVDVDYIPFTAELSVLPLNGFMLVGEELVLIETMSTELTLRDKHDIEFYIDAFERLQESALTGSSAIAALGGLYSAPTNIVITEQRGPRSVAEQR